MMMVIRVHAWDGSEVEAGHPSMLVWGETESVGAAATGDVGTSGSGDDDGVVGVREKLSIRPGCGICQFPSGF